MKKFWRIVIVFLVIISGLAIKNHFFRSPSPELKMNVIAIKGDKFAYILHIKEGDKQFHKIKRSNGKYVVNIFERKITVYRKERDYGKIMEFDCSEVLNSRMKGIWILKNPKVTIFKKEEKEQEKKDEEEKINTKINV